MSNEKKINIEECLNNGIRQTPVLDFEKLAAMPVVKMTEHDYITRPTATLSKKNWKMPRYLKPVSAAFISCLVMFVCITAWVVEFKTPDSVISLDANQSVEIVTNKHKQVLGVRAFNPEVQVLMDEQNINQGNLEDSISVIISTMIQNGYLDDSKNVVMVSVENQNAEKANDLAVSLNQTIISSATAQNVTTTVVMQSVVPDKAAVAQAEQYSVSAGKLKVMQEIVATDSSQKMDALAAMSLTDLLEVSKDKSVDLTKIIQVIPVEIPKDKTDSNTTDSITTENSVTVPTQTTNNNSNTNNQEFPVIDPIVVTTPETPTNITTPETVDEKQPESLEHDKTTQELPEAEKEKSSLERDPLQEGTVESDMMTETQEPQP